MEIGLISYIGQGVMIGVFEPIDSTQDEDEIYATLEYQGHHESFIFMRLIKSFPRIEGIVKPGICLLEENRGPYFALLDNHNLTNAFNKLDSYYNLESLKVVCLPDKLVLLSVAPAWLSTRLLTSTQVFRFNACTASPELSRAETQEMIVGPGGFKQPFALNFPRLCVADGQGAVSEIRRRLAADRARST